MRVSSARGVRRFGRRIDLHGTHKGKRVVIMVRSDLAGWVGELRGRHGLVVWETRPCQTPEVARALVLGALDFGTMVDYR